MTTTTKQTHLPIPWDCFPNEAQKTITVGNYKKGHPFVKRAAIVPGRNYRAWYNARFICLAVNNHESLLEACKAALYVLELEVYGQQTCILLKQAISKAEGK